MPLITAPITLNASEVYASLSNMIISQEIFADNIADGYRSLVDRARVDGGLYGDMKLFVATDVLRSYAWTGDNEASNLLNILSMTSLPTVLSLALSLSIQTSIGAQTITQFFLT